MGAERALGKADSAPPDSPLSSYLEEASEPLTPVTLGSSVRVTEPKEVLFWPREPLRDWSRALQVLTLPLTSIHRC